jgi:predicted Zn finger-like uncharacterized protein
MEIFCEKCHSKFKIADEKIPQGKTASLLCPKCKNRITFSSGQNSEEFTYDDMETTVDDSGEKPFDFVEEEGKTALICESDPTLKEKFASVLDIMEYYHTAAENSRDALKRMRYHTYDLILINEDFDTKQPDANPLLIFLERLNMSIRRDMFVVLLSRRLRTMDSMAAFHKSVNLIINLKNTNNFDQILSRALTDNNFFYRIFRESLKRAGRA